MELKFGMQHGVIGDAFQLLIEPFGIEINSDRRHRPALHYLLIEPFGIEISENGLKPPKNAFF